MVTKTKEVPVKTAIAAAAILALSDIIIEKQDDLCIVLFIYILDSVYKYLIDLIEQVENKYDIKMKDYARKAQFLKLKDDNILLCENRLTQRSKCWLTVTSLLPTDYE